MSLLPSAADCASSPSTTSSGNGGAEPTCQGVWLSPIASTSSGAEEERQALVAADVLVGAGIFIAGMADQHRSRHQFAELAPAVQAETALAHIGNRVTAMLLRERPVAGPRAAAKIGHGYQFALDERVRDHPGRSSYGPAAVQRAAARRTASCWRWGWCPRSTAAGAWRSPRHGVRSCRHSCPLRARGGRAR